jgi:predicted dehydrogenase
MKIAVFGTGNIAAAHLQPLQDVPDIEVVGLVNPTRAKAEAAAQKWGGQGYTDVHELLAHTEVDAAFVLVPPHMHGDIEMTLIAAGIPFMAEKPLTADRKTGEMIAEAVDRAGLIAAVGYQFRANDTNDAILEYLGTNPVRMVSGTWYGTTPGAAWWRRQAQSGGQFVEQATHLFDLARYLTGLEAVVLGASGATHPRDEYPDLDVDVVSAALVRFGDQVPGLFSATCLLNKGGMAELQLICDGMTIHAARTFTIFDDGRNPQTIPVQNNPYGTQNLAFIQAVRSGDDSPLYCTYDDALKTHQLVHTALEQMHPGL